jgi:hypothetical protein
MTKQLENGIKNQVNIPEMPALKSSIHLSKGFFEKS